MGISFNVQTTTSVRRQKSVSAGCLCIIGLPFLGVGLFVVYLGIASWALYFQSESWEKVPATLLSVEWKEYRGSKGGYTYNVLCTYHYRYQDREFTNKRVGVENSSSNIGSHHRTHYNLLKKSKDEGRPFMALINPAEPQSSLLFRDTSATMYILPLFGMIFVLVGGLIIAGGISGTVASRRKMARLQNDPKRPWIAETRWTNFSMASSSRTTMIGTWVGTFLTGAFISVFIIAFTSDPHVPGFVILILSLFALLPVGLCASAIHLTLGYVKYGNPRLILTQMPFVPGGPFTALLIVKEHLVTEHGVDCTLFCHHRLTTGSGKSTTTTTTLLHSETININRDMATIGDQSSAIPIQFNIPADKPTRDVDGNPSITWSLKAKAATPGINFAVTFNDLPVYNVEDPSLVQARPGA